MGQFILFVFRSLVGLFNLLRTRPIETLGVGFIGFATFVIVPNALFFQEGKHPSPLLRHSQLARFQDTQGLFTGSIPNQSMPAHIDDMSGMVLPNPRPKPEIRPQHITDASHGRSEAQSVVENPAVVKRVDPVIRGDKTVFAVQLLLADLGLYQDTVDGQFGPNTKRSIKNFERLHRLPITGQPTLQLLTKVQQVKATLDVAVGSTIVNASAPQDNNIKVADPVQRILNNANTGSGSDVRVQKAQESKRERITRIQRGLASLGYYRGNRITGELDELTKSAIRNFEIVHNYEATGEASQWLLEQLLRAGAVV